MRIRNFIVFTFFCMNIYSCKSSTGNHNTGIGIEKKPTMDTIILKDNCIVFLSPTLKMIDSLKNRLGEDFFTIADDANFYRAKDMEFLDESQFNYLNVEMNMTIAFYTDKKNRMIIPLKYESNNLWPVLFFNSESKHYEVGSLVDFKQTFNDFFSHRRNGTIDEIKEKMQQYSIVKEVTCDLNKDSKQDKILIFNPKEIVIPTDTPIMNSPVFILINNGNNTSYNIFQNDHIIYTAIPSCPADGFDNLVVKDKYLTIEQNICGGWYFINDYTTFKWDENSESFVLHKYGQAITDRREPEKKLPVKVYTSKNFGKITFENFNADLIKKILN